MRQYLFILFYFIFILYFVGWQAQRGQGCASAWVQMGRKVQVGGEGNGWGGHMSRWEMVWKSMNQLDAVPQWSRAQETAR